MSKINPAISNEQVIPVFNSDLFVGHGEKQFAVGMIAMGDQVLPGNEEAFDAYLRLRANVYAKQTEMIDHSQVRADGTERDADDGRSIHFGIFEQGVVDGTARAVAAIRLIVKTPEDSRKLPIEDFFPEAFANGPSPMGSTEVSRYIARHENPATQKRLSNPLFTSALGYILAHNLGPTFGVVESKVETDLKVKGVPLERIADPRYVPEYSAFNLGIEIDTATMGTNFGLDQAAREQIIQAERETRYFGSHRAPTPISPLHGAVA